MSATFNNFEVCLLFVLFRSTCPTLVSASVINITARKQLFGGGKGSFFFTAHCPSVSKVRAGTQDKKPGDRD